MVSYLKFSNVKIETLFESDAKFEIQNRDVVKKSRS
jgi:hypothetical protein